ncbi:response regulator, partial [Candidatus Parcubacteria bacterium]|nr:response regulator [Candidatus Parcubacteria bacterium]
MSNKKETILIIEDEKLLLDVLSKKLERENYNILTAVDGEDGAKKIIKHKPDLVLLDMVLPSLDGYDILQKIKDEKLDVPVIIISNSGQ